MDVVWHGLRDSLLMAWEVWWALVLGFAISAVVQAWVPRERISRSLGTDDAGAIAKATALGAASSSCSYAAVAIAKSLFEKGASAASALAFQLASTNLVWELGLVLWVLIGWQFTVAEYLGGIVMIALLVVALRLLLPKQVETGARAHAQQAGGGHDHDHHHDHNDHHDHGAGVAGQRPWRTVHGWSDVAASFLADWGMVWKEIAIGFLLSGFIAQLGNGFFQSLFVRHAPQPIPAIENVLLGPVIAVLSFVCSLGNVPLAAVLWSGGISFAGVLAFLFADLIIVPIVLIYRKYYGTRFTLIIVAAMFVSMAIAALIVSALFGGLGAIPTGPRPTRADIFASVRVDYKLFLNILGLLIFGAFLWLSGTRRSLRRLHRARPGLEPPT